MSTTATKYDDPAKIRKQCQAAFDLAVAEGRHSRTFQTVCDICRQWVDGIWFIVPGAGTRMCRGCCVNAGMIQYEGTRRN